MLLRYNSLADIWSFGITILELAHGHAPFARLPPMKVLLMTIQSPPPTLENDTGKKHFSKVNLLLDAVGVQKLLPESSLCLSVQEASSKSKVSQAERQGGQ